MKLWKKLMACTLAAVLALGVLTGCGQKVVTTDSFVNMLNRHLAQNHYYTNPDGVDISGADLKLTEGSECSKEANALLDKYVAAYQSWLKTDPILDDDEPRMWKIAKAMEDHPDKTIKTVTVAEKQVDGWYYLVAVTKLVNK